MMLKANCGNCSAFQKMAQNGVCRARPPIPIMIGMQQRPGIKGLAGPSAEPLVMSYFPPMKDTGWCREWEPRADMESAFMQAANGRQAASEPDAA